VVALRKGSNHQFYNDFSEDHDTINEPTSLTRPEARGLLSGFNTQGTPHVGFHHGAHLSQASEPHLSALSSDSARIGWPSEATLHLLDLVGCQPAFERRVL
jgi:hypothetical protein